jgi:predicted nucleic acid-binding protein
VVVKRDVEVPDGAIVLVDTNPIIYVLEGSPLAARFEPLFARVESGHIRALVTPITVAEVVMGPLKAGKEALAERYRRAITASRGWSVREIDADVAFLAARLRLRYKLKLPDALQLAIAVTEGCFALVTHDRDFSSVTELPILGA